MNATFWSSWHRVLDMNDTSKAIGIFFIGFLVGIVLLAIMFENSVYISPAAAKQLVLDCEQSLPRNQKCVLKAVPEKSNRERI